MNELQVTLNKISAQFDDDIISGFERRIKFHEKLLAQAIAFREECVQKGFVELIAGQDKKINHLRESIAKLNEEMVQAIESL
jgi:hypothetical protein